MENRGFYRVGAGCAMAGAALGVIFNLLHPRSAEAADDVGAELEMIANSGIWTLVHIMIGLAIALGVIGLIAVGLYMNERTGNIWPRVAVLAALPGVAIITAVVAVDGVALREIATQWSTAAQPQAIIPAADAVMRVTLALLVVAIGSQFGVTGVLFGVAILATGIFARGLGFASIAGGALGILTAILMAISGGDNLTLNVLFPIASLTNTVVLFVLGWQLWGRAQEPAGQPDTAAAISA